MLIGVCGSICAGKHTVAEYLIQNHGFLRLHLPHHSHRLADGQEEPRLLPSVADEKGTRGLTFPDVDALLDFVTRRWREHWVLTDIGDERTLDKLMVRPFFLLVGVDAPISLRFNRFRERCRRRHLDPWGLEKFVAVNDRQLYESVSIPDSSHPIDSPLNTTPITTLLARTHLTLQNTHTTLVSFFDDLSDLDLPSPSRLRPTWDAYFMTLAHLAAQRSNCMKRRVGCVLVTATHRIIATGYNGTPRHLTNCNAGGCARCNYSFPKHDSSNTTTGSSSGNLSTCLCLHAEENALLEAGRDRISLGTVLYCDTCPCLTCSVKIVQVGIGEVVFSRTYNMDEATARVFREAGVKLRQFSPPTGNGSSHKNGLVGAAVAVAGRVDGEEQEGQTEKAVVVLRNGM